MALIIDFNSTIQSSITILIQTVFQCFDYCSDFLYLLLKLKYWWTKIVFLYFNRLNYSF